MDRALSLPSLRDDLRLLGAGAERDGSPGWTILDPARNRFFRIGWLEFELLSRWDAGDADSIASQVSAETTLSADRGDVEALTRFLERHQLIAARDARGTARLESIRRHQRHGILRRLLHNYLFFRIPLVRPQRFLQRTLPVAAVFMQPATLALIGIAGLVGLALAARQWDSFTASLAAAFTPAGVFGFLCALAVAKSLHELGHAYVATRAGVRVAHMGMAFVVMWPMLYTDTGETWKLADARTRFAIASAGLVTELAVAALATLGWSLTADGALRDALFFLATTSWLISIGINASPFMRFDGYFLLSDALDLPNLHERASALARAAMRRLLLGWDEPDPEQFPPRLKRGLVGFALVTWAIRLAVFVGIAIAVYHYFFKALGVALFAVEIGWFVVRPLASEFRVWWERRRETTAGRRSAWLALLIAGGAVLVVPWRQDISAPAWAHAQSQHPVFAPYAGRLVGAPPKPGPVAAGALLFTLDSPDVRSREGRARISAETLALQLARLPGTPDNLDRRAVLAQSWTRHMAEAEGEAAEQERLDLRAPVAGLLLDVDPLIADGVWVRPDQQLGIVADPSRWIVEGFVGERELARVRVGDPARFYPVKGGGEPLPGRVTTIDSTRVTQLPSSALAGQHGGAIATGGGPADLAPKTALYRVRIALDPGPALRAVATGTVVIEGRRHSLIGPALRDAASALIRESGV